MQFSFLDLMRPMQTHTVAGVTVELAQGDIAAQEDIAAVVNAANAELRTGGGVAGALHRAAGPGLAEEGQPLAPLQPGEAVLTGGHDLPNAYVIHCLGPVYGRDTPEDELLRACYREALQLAEENDIASVAFPALSTGAFGYPLEEATEMALRAVLERLPDLVAVRTVRFVLYDRRAYEVYEHTLTRLLEEKRDA